MSLFFIDGKVTIDDVVLNSPAHKAGFRKDDVVVAVNTNFSNDITQYKNLLQTEGDKLKVIITRNNTLQIINFKVGKIY
jgi:S1-C subfamily serine protease